MIQLLDQKTIDRIAAGEVVDRPASVIKELMENSIDSKANAITVEIRNGGIDLIRVTDNGCGIPSGEIRTAFLRHATSKLSDASELPYVSTLGFRGEALSSIGAVSRMEVITRTADQICGTRYRIEGGTEISFEEVGAPFGTTMIMRNLFFNTPARAKFLRSARSEAASASAFVEMLALSHPEISVNFINDGTARLFTSGSSDIRQTIYEIYGKEITKLLRPINRVCEDLSVTGYIGSPEIARGNRNYEIYFINGRFVRDKILSSAIEDAYQGELMKHKYPFTVLYISTKDGQVDVNVHPSKQEVRFSNRMKVYEQLFEIVNCGIKENRSVPDLEIPAPVKAGVPSAKGPRPQSVEKNESNIAAPVDRAGTAAGNTVSRSVSPPGDAPKMAEPVESKTPLEHRPEPFEQKRRTNVPEIAKFTGNEAKQIDIFKESQADPDFSEKIHYLGQVFDTYCLAEYENKFYIIDQHAAHEKIMYEKLLKMSQTGKIYSQRLLPPILLLLTERDIGILNEHMDEFRSLGFEIEFFGGKEYTLSGVPAFFDNTMSKDLFMSILDDLNTHGKNTPTLLLEKIASRACRSAIKANMRLDDQEIKALLVELFQLEDPYHCPHGRPTMIGMTRYELDKSFKRII